MYSTCTCMYMWLEGQVNLLKKTYHCSLSNSSCLPVDGVNCHNSITAHIRVAMFQTVSDGWHERLQQLGFLLYKEQTIKYLM